MVYLDFRPIIQSITPRRVDPLEGLQQLIHKTYALLQL